MECGKPPITPRGGQGDGAEKPIGCAAPESANSARREKMIIRIQKKNPAFGIAERASHERSLSDRLGNLPGRANLGQARELQRRHRAEFAKIIRNSRRNARPADQTSPSAPETNASNFGECSFFP